MSTTLVITQTENETEKEEKAEEPEKPAREAELFVFENCSKGLGLKICGGCSIDGEELNGVFIKRILPGGLADVQGGLQTGDQILEVNGNSLEGVTNDRAVSHLRLACASNYVEIVICRDSLAQQEFRDIMEKNNGCSFPGTPVPADSQSKGHLDLMKKTSVSSTETGAGPVQGEESLSQVTPINTPEAGTQAGQMGQEPTLPTGVTPKLPWRGLIPSMASTPHNRISTGSGRTGSSGSQFSIYPQGEPSPVGHPILSQTTTTDMSSGSVFGHNTTIGQPPEASNMSLSRKFSLDPYVRLKMEKLKTALQYLGLDPSPEKELAMRSKLNVDSAGTVKYGDFVEVVKEVFQTELKEMNIGSGTMMFDAGSLTDLMEPPAFRPETNGGASGFSQHQLEQENEELRQENLRLQVLLREKEDEVLKIRKEAQGIITQQRTLQSKVHLAAEAQKAARDMEHDYEEVVHLLEGEIAQLKLQLSSHSEADPIMQRRLAVLTCQLRKAESEKETFKVATDKLLQFAETVYETLSETGATSRPLSGIGSKATGFLGKHKSSSRSTKSVANDAKEVVKTVRSIIDTQPLPFGWEETYTEDGMKYYINHLNQVTTWSHPLSNVTHLPTIHDDKRSKGSEPKPSGSAE